MIANDETSPESEEESSALSEIEQMMFNLPDDIFIQVLEFVDSPQELADLLASSENTHFQLRQMIENNVLWRRTFRSHFGIAAERNHTYDLEASGAARISWEREYQLVFEGIRAFLFDLREAAVILVIPPRWRDVTNLTLQGLNLGITDNAVNIQYMVQLRSFGVDALISGLNGAQISIFRDLHWNYLTLVRNLALVGIAFERLPASIGGMVSLERMLVEFADLVAVDGDWSQLDRLIHVTLSNNELSRVPEQVLQLPKLQILNVSNNSEGFIVPRELTTVEKLVISPHQLSPESRETVRVLRDRGIVIEESDV